jgi:hypothetical protein
MKEMIFTMVADDGEVEVVVVDSLKCKNQTSRPFD